MQSGAGRSDVKNNFHNRQAQWEKIVFKDPTPCTFLSSIQYRARIMKWINDHIKSSV
jgi:hypothetical protein